jgi:hypothetical protein
MALKCVTCGLLFRSRNELDLHVRDEHLRARVPPAEKEPAPATAEPAAERAEAAVGSWPVPAA